MIIKLVLLGDTSVGKTKLIQRFLTEKFEESSKPTIGIDFETKDVPVEDKVVKV